MGTIAALVILIFIAAQYAAYTLASYRVAMLLSQEDGPYDVFKRFRAYNGIVHGKYVNTEGFEVGFMMLSEEATMLGRLLSCPHCTSGWTSLIASVLFCLSIFPVLNIGILGYCILCWFSIWALNRILIKKVEDI